MPTKAQAIDHLIDVLAGSDIKTTGTTAQRVMRLADMIEDGEISIGGGGGRSGTAEIYRHVSTMAHADTAKMTATFTVPDADKMVEVAQRVLADPDDFVVYAQGENGEASFFTSGYNESEDYAYADWVILHDAVLYCALPGGDFGNYQWDTTDPSFNEEFGLQFDPSDIAADGSLTLTMSIVEMPAM